VLKLRETFTTVVSEKTRLFHENEHLKALLRQNGIAYRRVEGSLSGASLGCSPSISTSDNSHLLNAYSPFTPPSTSKSLAPSTAPSIQVLPHAKPNSELGPPSAGHASIPPVEAAHGIDYEQAGIDFVLTYDLPYQSSTSLTPAKRP
jgi:hypothetical protein